MATRHRRISRALLAIAAAALILAVHPFAALGADSPFRPPAPARGPAGERILPMEATVNGSKGGTWVFVERDGILYAPRDAFSEWRVQLNPEATPIDFKGEAYWPLTAVPGFKAKVNFATQSVELAFSPESFTALRLSKALTKRPVVSPVLPSAFVNYDFSYTGSRLRGAPNINEVGLLTEFGVSNAWGVLTSSHGARNLARDQFLGTPRKFVRLETTFTRDFPEENRTLRLGDSSTRAGMWGRNVYFGGIQYGTNFALTPGFISQPLPVFAGLSTSPSTVELYINDVMRQVSTVPTGPFTIDNFPTMTGNGEARIVVRDVLGRETVLTQAFFTSGQLLVPELDDFSIEAGAVRRQLGIKSSDYGPTFLSATWRRGITQILTLEGRAELSWEGQTFGVGASTALPFDLLGTAAVGASEYQRLGRGTRWLLGLDHTGLSSSLSLQAQGSTRRFRQLGQEEEVEPYRTQFAGNWTYFTQSLGSFGLGFATLDRFDGPRVSTVSANYSIGLAQRSSLTLSLSRAVSGAEGTSAGLSFVMPLGADKFVTATSNSHGGVHDFFATVSKGIGRDSNLGWRALAGRQSEQARAEAGAYYQGPYGNLSGELSGSRDRTAVRVGATGGLVVADGVFFVTRRVDQAFVVAEVKGYPGVGMGIGSTIIARTNKDGVALVPNLWPYDVNQIRLDPQDLPVAAEIDSIEQSVVPAWRSAVKVTFPVRAGRGALLRLVFDDGEPAPAGATVSLEGQKEIFYVARRGEAFVTGLEPSTRLRLNWKGRQCAFEVVLPPENPDEVPRLGPIACKGIPR